MSVDYEYDDDAAASDDIVINDGAAGHSDPLENPQNPPWTIVEDEVAEPRNTTLDEEESHDPSNGEKKTKKKKHAKKKKKHTKKKRDQKKKVRKGVAPEKGKKEAKKDGMTRTLLRS
jgi:hypothetical protein